MARLPPAATLTTKPWDTAAGHPSRLPSAPGTKSPPPGLHTLLLPRPPSPPLLAVTCPVSGFLVSGVWQAPSMWGLRAGALLDPPAFLSLCGWSLISSPCKACLDLQCHLGPRALCLSPDVYLDVGREHICLVVLSLLDVQSAEDTERCRRDAQRVGKEWMLPTTSTRGKGTMPRVVSQRRQKEHLGTLGDTPSKSKIELSLSCTQGKMDPSES